MYNRKLSGEYYTPVSVSEFVAELASNLPFKRILDPACGSASLLASVAARKGDIEVVGIDINGDILSQAEDTLKKAGSRFQLINADFFSVSRDKLGVFDLVVCNPPFGIKFDKEIDGLKLRSAEAAFILQSLRFLQSEGYLIFVVPEGLLFNEANHQFREHLTRQYSLEAIVSLTPDAFRPFTAIKTSLLMARKSKPTGSVFFAEYAEEQALKAIVSNLTKRTSNNNLSQGFWIDADNIWQAGPIWAYSRFRSLMDFEIKKKSSKFPVRFLSELVTFGRNDSEVVETILIQRVGAQPKAILKSELSETSNRQNYIECTLIDEGVLPQYLKLYLNSEHGKSQLSSLPGGSVIPSLRVQDLGSIYVEVPDLSIQSQIVATSQKLLEVSARVQLAAQGFYSHLFDYAELHPLVERFNQADEKDLSFERLIWPLATSYRIATKGSPNVTSQLDSYFKMFEMVAALSSIVLLSAMPREVRERYDREIWADNKGQYAKVSFGLWVALHRRLANFCTKLASDKKEGAPLLQSLPFGKEFYLNLSHRELLKILEGVPEKRNKLGGAAHGGITPEIVAQKAVNDLHPSLVAVFEKLTTAYSVLDFVYPQSMKKSNGLYTIRIKKLQGTHYPFSEEEIQTEIDMNTETLYLLNPVSGHRLELLSEFIKLIQCESCGHWSLFFFSKVDGKKTDYISYQNEIHGFTGQTSGLLHSLRST